MMYTICADPSEIGMFQDIDALNVPELVRQRLGPSYFTVAEVLPSFSCYSSLGNMNSNTKELLHPCLLIIKNRTLFPFFFMCVQDVRST